MLVQASLPFIDKELNYNSKYYIKSFSADSLCDDTERKKIEEKYFPLVKVTNEFNRQSVSYQLSKTDSIHSWLKYKEGFSASLVNKLINILNIKQGETILDPFLGSGTTAIESQRHGINCIGFDIMPMTQLSIKAKEKISKYDIEELNDFLNNFLAEERPKTYLQKTKYIQITNFAYPEETALDLEYFTNFIDNSSYSDKVKYAAKLCILNCLENISYTSKDGQYLRWDKRSYKFIFANKKRIEQGKAPFKTELYKGDIPSLKNCFKKKFINIIDDIKQLKEHNSLNINAYINFIQNSALLELPKIQKNTIDAVITSPPYCNRYDYTRIYALELVYLGLGEDEIKKLRQSLLCCTVENKPKLDYLCDYYTSINRHKDFEKIIDIVNNSSALTESIKALEKRNSLGFINNTGVISMVKGYFFDLAFIYYELFRICKPGAKVAFVNDNVRFAGEIIPVDFISTNLAENIGFNAECIFTLKQQKGNSSQQMKKFGRAPLRKSITIWKR